MVISFDNLLKILPRFASIAPLNRLTFDHLLCPAIRADYVQLLIETANFRTTARPENGQQEGKLTRNIQSYYAPFVNIRHRTARSNFGRVPSGANAHCELCRAGQFRAHCRNPCRDRDQCFLLELVWLSLCVHGQLHVDPDRRLLSCGSCCCARLAKARSVA